MIHLRHPFILCLLLTATRMQAVCSRPSDTIPASDRALIHASYAIGFAGDLRSNPTLYHDYTPYSWTDLRLNGHLNHKGQAFVRQEGSQDMSLGMEVRSFVVLSQQSRVFGSAGYLNRRQDHVVWNENLDWALIAPYVTGDSIGGHLKGETYYFDGGYTHESGRWLWGIAGGYRATHNYRDQDPRPRNTVSDLTATLTMGYRLGHYRLGISTGFRLYGQQSEILFLSDRGSTSVYHPLGMGMHYVRFAGDRTSTTHQGLQWSGHLGIHPAGHREGWMGTGGVTRFSVDKKLDDANHLTMARLDVTKWEATIAWLRPHTPTTDFGVKLHLDHTTRRGKEYLYGEAGGSSYSHLIGTSPGISVSATRITSEALWEQLPPASTAVGWALRPAIGYGYLNASHRASSRHVRVAALTPHLRARIDYRKRKLHAAAELIAAYHATLTAESRLPGLNAEQSAAQTLLANTALLTDSRRTFGVGLTSRYAITPDYNVQLSLRWQAHTYRRHGTAQQASCSLGIFF